MLSGAGSASWVERRLRSDRRGDRRSGRGRRSRQRSAARTCRRQRVRGDVRSRRRADGRDTAAAPNPRRVRSARHPDHRAPEPTATLRRAPVPIRPGRSRRRPARGAARRDARPRCRAADGCRSRRLRRVARGTGRRRESRSRRSTSRPTPRRRRRPTAQPPPRQPGTRSDTATSRHRRGGRRCRAVRPRRAVRARARQPHPRHGVPDLRRPARDRGAHRDHPSATTGDAGAAERRDDRHRPFTRARASTRPRCGAGPGPGVHRGRGRRAVDLAHPPPHRRRGLVARRSPTAARGAVRRS